MSAPETVRLAAFGFAQDAVTAEVTTALAAAGVPTVLLKGAAIATWLYAEDGSRLYGDTDLLLRGADWERAIGVLRSLGFEDDLGPLTHPRMESGAGHPWTRRHDGAAVDLHRTLFGIDGPAEAVWAEFSRAAPVRAVGGARVAMPPYPARLLHIALHAVQHAGPALPKAMSDLERALDRAPRAQWRQGLELARRLDAEAAFAAGLRLTPAGARMAAELGAGGDSVDAALRLGGVPLAEGLAELAAASGWRAKLALVLRELFPSRAFMRWRTPLARRGRPGLAAAYGWRLLWLAYRLPRGFLAWRRAVRRAAAGPQERPDR